MADEGNATFQSKADLVDKDDLKDEKKEFWSCQNTVALLGFAGISVIYGMRVNLSVAIVAMVGSSNTSGIYSNNSDELACPYPDGESEDDSYTEGEFDWSEKQQGYVLGSFYWGYIFTNVLGGMAAERYGGRLVMGMGVLLTGILTVLSPLAARVSSGFFIAVRTIEGVTEGVAFPAMNALLASWVLPHQRSRIAGFVYAGVHFGTVITLSVSGLMCESTFLGGWPSVFYVFGGLAIIWSILWFTFIRDSPQQHPRISQRELKKLQPLSLLKSEGNKVLPWKSIATSPPFWGLAIVHFGYNWGFYTLLSELPTYFNQIHHFDMSSNGLLSALPYFITWVVSVIFSPLMTYMTQRKKLTILQVRKLAMAISGFIPMLGLIGMCFADCNKTLAIVFLCFSVGACGTCYAGYMCSHMDIAPRYAGTLFGITNTIASIPGFVSPVLVGTITEDNQTLKAWKSIFLLAAIIYAITTVAYLILIQADVQPWNYHGTDIAAEKSDSRKSSHSSKLSELKVSNLTDDKL